MLEGPISQKSSYRRGASIGYRKRETMSNTIRQLLGAYLTIKMLS